MREVAEPFMLAMLFVFGAGAYMLIFGDEHTRGRTYLCAPEWYCPAYSVYTKALSDCHFERRLFFSGCEQYAKNIAKGIPNE